MFSQMLNLLDRHPDSDIDNSKFLSKREENRLIRAYQRAMAKGVKTMAIDQLIHEHRPLLLSLVKNELVLYERVIESATITHEDLLQVAIEEFCRSALKHDCSEVRLATYASYRIKGVLGAYVRANFGPVRLGTNFYDKKAIVAFYRVREFVLRHFGRDIQADDAPQVAKWGGVAEDVARRIVLRLTAYDIPVDNQYQPDGKAFEPYPDTGRYAIKGTVPVDPAYAEICAQKDPLEETALKHDGARLTALVATLPERERDIVLAYMDADGPRDRLELAARFGVTPERIRQIYRRSMRTLRQLAEQPTPVMRPDAIPAAAPRQAPAPQARIRPEAVMPEIRPMAAPVPADADHVVALDGGQRLAIEKGFLVLRTDGAETRIRLTGTLQARVGRQLKPGRRYRLVPDDEA